MPPIDPYRHRRSYVALISNLYHAEAAALEGFRLLNDPRYVESSEIFAKASKKLVEDEQKHLEDMECIVRKLGAGGIVDPPEHTRAFWTGWRSGRMFALPFKPAVASMFCLFSEGLGYGFLYLLAEATSDPEIRAMLQSNVRDEEAHVRLSVSVLRRAQVEDPRFMADFLVHVYGYGLNARKAIREHLDLFDDLGLDFGVLLGSTLRFLFELIDRVFDEEQRRSPLWQAAGRFMAMLDDYPDMARLIQLGMYLPTPPGSASAVYAWGRMRQRGRREHEKHIEHREDIGASHGRSGWENGRPTPSSLAPGSLA
ncbi:hypothetical protein [Pendulispora albinea]|uniref:Ferritin-like domain-containing protein n=1 Tax=Pendulispora albinea TaxID=2741071 RepID=A0ABZ2LL37_9BACT